MAHSPFAPLFVSLALAFSNGAAPALAQVDTSPLRLEPQVAFPQVKWSGWAPLQRDGLAEPLRPVVLTHAGDDRLFVATQRGVIHVFPNSQQVKETTVFLDIRSKVAYDDKQNEEGLLGLAFHPNYRQTGQLFVYYTSADSPHTSVISRFRVSADDPNGADPNSEEEILRVAQPFWNHNGGTIRFGPDRFLYIALGDGGSANDPHGNGQNLETLLGSILRIDVDRKDEGKDYAIPSDNPFVHLREGVRGEI